MKLHKIKDILKRGNVRSAMIFLITFVVIYMVTVTSGIVSTKKYSYQVGDIAKDDIEAPREVLDQMSTDKNKSDAINAVPLQYSKKTDVKFKVTGEIDSLFVQVSQIKDSTIDEKTKSDKLKAESAISLTDDDYRLLLSFSKDDLKALNTFLDKTMTNIYDNDNIEEDTGDNTNEAKDSFKKAKDDILLAFNSSSDATSFSKDIKSVGTNIANAELKPNFFFDKEKTDELKKDAEKKVAQVIIKKDQLIVKKGEPVTANQIEILKDLGLLNYNNNINWYIYVTLGVLVLLILTLQWFYLYKYHLELYNDHSKLLLINILNIISLILARTLSIISPFLIPFACIPMLMSLLLNYKVAQPISILNCIIMSVLVGFKPDITLLALVNAVLTGIILRKMQQRNDILYSSLFFAIINFILTFSVGYLLSNNTFEVLTKSAFAFISAIISAVLTIGFLPFFESIFDIVTVVKLLELSNPNNPLLRKLLVEAPGTYHHSILVANLAEVAAEGVGGNTVLTRVAAYYHDIGKIKRPYFFKENQMGNDNPHDKITANLSTLIITSHVKDGIEMAKENKIPKVIRDVIEQHHGTSLVKYFYLVVKNSSDKPEEVNEESFRYQGPIPTSKEAGIIMLADAVEAAVRSISNPTQGKIEEMVNNIIKERLNEGQLDNCDLTLKDLDIIRKAFLKSLTGIYHKRIEYPTDKWENKK